MTALSYPLTQHLSHETIPSQGQPAAPARQYSLEDFNQLVLDYQDAVFRQAFWMMGEEEAAEDAVQEAFIRAYQHMHTFNGGPFLPWILRITTNYCLDQLRKLKVRRTVRLEGWNEFDEEIEDSTWLMDPGESVEATIERSEVCAQVMRCIHQLPAVYRAPVVMVDMQEMDYQEAAAALGIPMGTFKSRLSRARALLQKQLSRERQAWLN